MGTFDFDSVIERREDESIKWCYYEDDVLPMWVADMDFSSPPAVMEALHERVDAAHFGYTFDCSDLRRIICQRMKRLYDWDVDPQHLLFSPGLVVGLNVVARAIGKPGDAVLMNTPVYGPFLKAPANNARFAFTLDMRYVADDDHTFHYEIDWDAFEKAAAHPQASLFYMCNPHNPAGFMWREDDLRRVAEICMMNKVIMVADEIHHDLLLADRPHIPLASLSPEISQHTITMIAPSKTFNIPGLGVSALIVQDEALRKQVENSLWSSGAHVNILGYSAGVAAYQQGQPWLDELLPYLRANRDIVVQTVREDIPGLKTTVPEATYLAWFDCRALGVEGDLQQFFLEKAKVAMNPGTFFGNAGEGFVRLNFGCPRSLLQEGLKRIAAAIEGIKS